MTTFGNFDRWAFAILVAFAITSVIAYVGLVVFIIVRAELRPVDAPNAGAYWPSWIGKRLPHRHRWRPVTRGFNAGKTIHGRQCVRCWRTTSIPSPATHPS